jgi:hypothetical protein
MDSQRVPNWVWTALVAGHILALSWALATGRWNFPDSDRYLQAAANLWHHGQLYAKPWLGSAPQGKAVQEFTIRPPGYPLVVLGLGASTGQPLFLLAVQCLLSIFAIGRVLVWWARWAAPKAKCWGLAVAGMATFPAQFIYANAVMSEIVLQAVIMALAVACLLYIKRKSYGSAAVIMVALVLALLIKPVFYPLAVVVACLGVVAAWRRMRPLLAVLGLVPALVVTLYMGWNEQRTGNFHFSSITDINLLHYNAAGVVRQINGIEAEEKWVDDVLREANAQASFAARQQVIQARAKAMIWAHPVVYAQQHLLGMATFFLDPGRFDVSEFLGVAPPPGGGLLSQVRAGGLVRAIIKLPWGMLGWLGIVFAANVARLWLAWQGFKRLGHEGPIARHGRWVAVGLLLYVAALTGPLGATRFLVPVWPLLFTLALAGLHSKPSISAVAAGAANV